MAPFRSDDEIRALADEAMREVGKPRCLFMTGVLPLAGLSYENPATRDEYVEKVFPFDDEKVRYQYAATASACGIVTEIGWRYAGVDWPVLWKSYLSRVAKGQFAVVEEGKAARHYGAWVDTTRWVEGMPLPMPGDAPTIGCASCGADWHRNSFNGEHEYTMLAYEPSGSGVFHALDGGQPGIAFRTRAHVQVFTGEDAEGRRTGELWVAAVDNQGRPMIAADNRPSTGRRMVGYVDVSKLPLGQPEGPCLDSQGDTVGGYLDSPWVKGAAAAGLTVGAYLALRKWAPGVLRRVGL